MKLNILAGLVGAELAVLGLFTHYLLHKYDTLWITIPAIAILTIINYMVASFSYETQNINTITTGDIHVAKYGIVHLDLPIVLITATLLYWSYFSNEDSRAFTSTLTLTYCFYIYYSWPVAQLDENGKKLE
jgi:hypothetical protein